MNCKNMDHTKRDLTRLLENIYTLFDYKVHEYWCNNIYQSTYSDYACSRSMFGHRSSMRLILNSHNDLQYRLKDKARLVIYDFLSDNRSCQLSLK